MLHVELYEKSLDLYNLSFVSDQTKESTIICPNPFIADTVRERINAEKLTGQLTVLTIAKYIKDELKEGFGKVETVSKADLILRLGTIWRQYFSNYADEIFFQSFNLFTELRGFSLSYELVTDVLSEYDDVIAKAVQIFWLYVDEVELVDEQCSYAMLVDAYRQIEHPVHKAETNIVIGKNIIFWGFAHLSASQVDLLKALAIRHDVYVPFPASVFDKTKSTDWIRWLTTEEFQSELNISSRKLKQCNIVTFSKNRLGETLVRFKDHLRSEKPKSIDIFLAMKNPTQDHFDEIPFDNMHYKTAVDLFQDVLAQLVSKCREELFSSSIVEVEIADLLQFLKETTQAEIFSKQKQKDYKLIKAAGLIGSAINQWSNLSDANDKVSLFDFKLIEHVASLKSPRNFFAPLLNDQATGAIKGLEAIDSYNDENLTIICASSSYSPIRGEKPSYTDEVLQVLKNIGPIKRKELEYLTTFHRLMEMLNHPQTYLFVEGDLLEHDLAWSELLDGCERISVDLSPRKQLESEQDYLNQAIQHKSFPLPSISATRLQSYVDCPRSYYFKYIENLSIYPRLENRLRADQLGVLQHKVIEDYLQTYHCWGEVNHLKTVQNCLDEYLLKENMLISNLDYQSYLIEIRDYSRNGIQALLNLKEMFSEASFQFEFSLTKQTDENVTGSVDCIVSIGEGIGVLDFKRSKSSIPTKSELDRFDKIQLWFYLKSLKFLKKDFLFWGYLNLSDPQESLIFTKDDLILEKIKATNVTADKNVMASKVNVYETIEEYRAFESDLIKSIETDCSYQPTPRKSSVCTFCSVANICPREIV